MAALLYLMTGLWQAQHDSVTVDEAVDLAAGVTSLVRHDLRLNPEHGPLPKAVSALPALVARPVVPDTDAYRDGDWFDYTDDFIRANAEAGRLDRIVFLSRLAPLAEGLGCAWLIFVLGRRFLGANAGAAGAALWLTTPLVVGFAHLNGIDIAFALATLWVAHRIAVHVSAPSLRTASWLGVACSAALLTRHSGLSLWAYATTVVVAVMWRSNRRDAVRMAAAVVAIGFVGVWVTVRLIAPAGAPEIMQARSDALVADASQRSTVARVSLAVPFPTEYRAGLAYLVVTSDERPAYLFGHAWDGSRWWYFPGSALAKLPLGATAALVLAPVACWRLADLDRRRFALAMVGPAVVSLGFVMSQPLNLGVRYVLPTIALAYVGAGAALTAWSTRPRQVACVLVGAMQLWAVAGAGGASLAWTPWPFQPAYRWVSDSNIDYGQDLDRVVDWADVHPGATVSLLRPRGVDNPAGTSDLRDALDAGSSTVTGWVAVSATRLTVLDRDRLSWLRAYCPVDLIGSSVLVYHFGRPPDLTDGPVMPAAPCWGAAHSSRS